MTRVLLLCAAAAAFSQVNKAPKKASMFPTRETPPTAVLAAQLSALQRRDIAGAFALFSRARKLQITETAAVDRRQTAIPLDVVLRKLEDALDESCPGLLGHERCEVLSSLALSEYDGVHLPKWRCRVRVLGEGGAARSYQFHLTRQSDPPPPTIDFDEKYDKCRDIDGFEGCWFVWRIEPEDGGLEVAAAPTPELVPA